MSIYRRKDTPSPLCLRGTTTESGPAASMQCASRTTRPLHMIAVVQIQTALLVPICHPSSFWSSSSSFPCTLCSCFPQAKGSSCDTQFKQASFLTMESQGTGNIPFIVVLGGDSIPPHYTTQTFSCCHPTPKREIGLARCGGKLSNIPLSFSFARERSQKKLEVPSISSLPILMRMFSIQSLTGVAAEVTELNSNRKGPASCREDAQSPGSRGIPLH